MLNISPYSVRDRINQKDYSSLDSVESKQSGQTLKRLIIAFFLVVFVFLFLPWTQNIRSKGFLTALQPEHRPQSIQSVISGRIEKWFVMEGDYVKKGDTIMFLSEIKDEYFDPNLLDRTRQQLNAKELSVQSYKENVRAKENRVIALVKTGKLKMEQAQNKLQQAGLKTESDSIDYEAAKTNYRIAEEQYKRAETLYEEGLRSLTDLENRRLNLQKAQAQMISAENDLLTSRNEIINARVELTSLEAQYQDEIAKAEAEKFTTMSSLYDAEAGVTKLENQYTNYSLRTGMYYVTAPIDGYITKAIQTGIGETLKEGTSIVSIMPADYELAIEMFVRPLDLPLIQKGQHVRILFDGWPAIVFAGWPEQSYGTFGGRVLAIDNFISDNGLYRVLVVQDSEGKDWPDALRVGSGTSNMVLLKDVPIWYELWRNLNGFPPDFYRPENQQTEKKA